MIKRGQLPRDPFEGRGEHRRQLRLRVEGLIALGLAVGACGMAAALWIQTVAPFAGALGLN